MRTYTLGRRRAFGFVALASVALLPAVAHATSYTIETTNVDLANDGLCSLREAIQASTTLTAVNGADDCPAGTGDDSIFLPPGTYTSSVTLTIGHTLRILGTGMDSSIVKSSNGFTPAQLFSVSPGGRLVLDDLSIRSGTGTAATRGIYSSRGSVELYGVSVSGFRASGIYSTATSAANGSLYLDQSVIKNNTTALDGGGIYNGDFVSLAVFRSTINNNTAGGKGGGIYHRGWGNSNMGRTTISDNSAARGGGFYNGANGSGGNYFNTSRLTVAGNSASISGGGVVENTTTDNLFQVHFAVIAQNTAPANPDFEGEVFLSGSVLGPVGADADIVDGSEPNLIGVTASQVKLGPLMNMGGWYRSTPTRPLLKGSAAIDFITSDINGESILDQRGIDIQEGNGDRFWWLDAGAYEANTVWESEMSGYSSTSGDSYDADADIGYSGNFGSELYSDAANDYVVVPMYFAEAGTYSVKVGVKKSADAGRFKLGTSANTTTFNEYSATTDLYSASNAFTSVTYPNRTFPVGKQYFRFRVTDKVTASSNFRLYLDYIQITKI